MSEQSLLEAMAAVRARQAELRITSAAWREAIASTPDVQLVESGLSSLHDGTEVPAGPDDAEVLIDGSWQYVFSFYEGSISFIAVPDWMESGHPVRTVATTLATILGAKVLGDEGEEFDWE